MTRAEYIEALKNIRSIIDHMLEDLQKNPQKSESVEQKLEEVAKSVDLPVSSIEKDPVKTETNNQAADSGYKPLTALKESSPQPSDNATTTHSDEKPAENDKPREKETLPSAIGMTGEFDGEFVIMQDGRRFQVPPNYASKSLLVAGDLLQLVGDGDFNKFKIVKEIERVDVEGILMKKDNLWMVLVDTKDEYRVVTASVRFYNGEIGDKVTLILPHDYKERKPIWGAIKDLKSSGLNDSIYGSGGEDDVEDTQPATESQQPESTNTSKADSAPLKVDPKRFYPKGSPEYEAQQKMKNNPKPVEEKVVEKPEQKKGEDTPKAQKPQESQIEQPTKEVSKPHTQKNDSNVGAVNLESAGELTFNGDTDESSETKEPLDSVDPEQDGAIDDTIFDDIPALR